jgi:hypothetical protein
MVGFVMIVVVVVLIDDAGGVGCESREARTTAVEARRASDDMNAACNRKKHRATTAMHRISAERSRIAVDVDVDDVM